LPHVLKGFYDWEVLSRVILMNLGLSVGAALVGMYGFSRRDV